MESGSRLRKRLSTRVGWLIIGGALLGPVVGPATSSGYEQIVNIGGATHCGTTDEMAVSVELPAGTYTLVPIGPAEGGLYTAVNPWGGQVQGCGDGGADCERGWSWNVTYSLEGGFMTAFNVHRGFETAEMALESARSITIQLEDPTEIRFWNNDFVCEDNVGGLSFEIIEDRSISTTASTWSQTKALFR